jgi:hypothetical protein
MLSHHPTPAQKRECGDMLGRTVRFLYTDAYTARDRERPTSNEDQKGPIVVNCTNRWKKDNNIYHARGICVMKYSRKKKKCRSNHRLKKMSNR